jgi:hypothetical protein
MTAPRTSLLAAVACLAAAAPIAAATAQPAAPAAHAAATCSPPKYPGQGYFTSLKVAHVSCATGRKVTLAHYRCRTKHGIRGRCASVLGYHCTEYRQSIPTEIDSRVTCKRGTRRVVYTYQQNT